MCNIVDYDERKTGSNKAGNYFALITLFQRVGLGASVWPGLVITSMFGFDPGATIQASRWRVFRDISRRADPAESRASVTNSR
jgi:Na+/melibiose symporter-like transporter